MPEHNTLLIRLEGPLQSWGVVGKITYRPTELEPSKSGILGLLACALGRKRWCDIADLALLRVGVRVDRPGTLLRDYQTVGARIGNRQADGKLKKVDGKEGIVSVRTYLQDASFIAALQGDASLIADCAKALENPAWQLYLGRKSCPSSTPVLVGTSQHADLLSALKSVPWVRRWRNEAPPDTLRCFLESTPADDDAFERYDHPEYFWRDAKHQFARHWPRYVKQAEIKTSDLPPAEGPAWQGIRRPSRGYSTVKQDGLWAKTIRPMARERAKFEFNDVCVLTGLPYDHIHHLRYRDDIPEDADLNDPEMEARVKEHVEKELVPVSNLAHDAITILEYRYNMGAERIDPRCDEWRPRVLRLINQILAQRVRPTRRSGVRRK